MDAKSKKLYLIGGAIGVGVVGIIYLRSRNGGGSSSAAADSGNIDPSTGFPYGSAQDEAALAASGTGSEIDPATGYPYGSPQDNAALAAEGGTGGGFGFGGVPFTPAPTGGTGAPQTNAEWSEAVEQSLTAIGYNAQAVAVAVGKYLGKLPLTPEQATIIQVALAEDGNPPQGTYSIITGTGNPQPKPTTMVTVPNVVGMVQEDAFRAIADAGLKASGPAPVKGRTHVVTAEKPKAGSSIAKGSTVELTSKVAGRGSVLQPSSKPPIVTSGR